MNSVYLGMEKLLFSLVIGMMWQPKMFALWSIFHTVSLKATLILCAVCCESQHHRIAHVGRELGRSLLQPPAHSRLALRSDQAAQGFIQQGDSTSVGSLLQCLAHKGELYEQSELLSFPFMPIQLCLLSLLLKYTVLKNSSPSKVYICILKYNTSHSVQTCTLKHMPPAQNNFPLNTAPRCCGSAGRLNCCQSSSLVAAQATYFLKKQLDANAKRWAGVTCKVLQRQVT